MELILKDVVLSYAPLRELNQMRGLKGSTAYRIAKNFMLIDEEIKPYAEAEQKISQRYAVKDENGKFRITEDGQYIFNAADALVVQKELNSLQNEKVNLAIKKVPFEDLEDAGLSGAQLAAIEFMLDFGDE